MKKKIVIAIILIFIIALSTIGVNELKTVSPTAAVQATISPTAKKITSLSYQGSNGKDALTLLKQQASVEQDHSGLVVSIDDTKPIGHAYWAFYVNGKLASVGPAEYVTKNGDKIEWKIEKY